MPFERRSQTTRRNAFAHWLPLILTVSVATVGLAAWAWSERRDDDEDTPHYGRDESKNLRTSVNSDDNVHERDAGDGAASRPTQESPSYMARMSGALRRTPSPQEVFDGASRTVVGGLAAAGAVVGNALSSIREEIKDPYADHRTWSEEAALRKTGVSRAEEGITSASRSREESSQKGPSARSKRKVVALVVSAANGALDNDHENYQHASILSHLPKSIDISRVSLFVLIYAPNLQDHPLSTRIRRPGDSISSSFTTIEHEQAQTPTEEASKLLASSSTTNSFQAVYSEALSLVENETMVMPFTTPQGHEHMLRHLGPDVVYLQESLSGENGDVVTHLQSWMRQDVVIVVGADGGHGGLADSEDEVSQLGGGEHWWELEERVGRGRGVVVLEGLNIGDDWSRRVECRE